MDIFVINFKRIITIFAFLILFLCNIFAEELIEEVIEEKPPVSYVMISNLSSKSIDIRVGQNQNNFNIKADKLKPFSSTYINEIEPSSNHKIYFRINKRKWFFLSEDFIEPFSCDLQEDKVYCILVNEESVVFLHELGDYTYSQDQSFIGFLNGSANEIVKVRFADQWGVKMLDENENNVYDKNEELTIKNIDRYGFKKFRQIKYDTYKLFWQSYEQKQDGKYSLYIDESTGASGDFTFNSGRIYMFMTWYKDHLNYAAVYDVTPR